MPPPSPATSRREIDIESTTELGLVAPPAPKCNISLQGWTKNMQVLNFIQEAINLCQPDSVYVCDGSEAEYDMICTKLVQEGVFRPLAKRPRSYWCHTDPEDVARVESRTFICSTTKQDAGPTNNWMDPAEMKTILKGKFRGCMRGRTMYVMAFCMGPIGSKLSHIGIEISDSPYVAVNMQIMTRLGDRVIQQLGEGDFFVPCLHSVGMPLLPGMKDVVWPCNKEKYIVQFPEERSVWSFGSGYGGNALLNKKCFALRIASVLARDQGWLAEHMLILGFTSPQGETKYFCAAFPSGCGKTNLAMLQPTLPGWKVECIGDDIAWLKYGEDGQLYAINPENGFFGIAPGTSNSTNPNAMECLNTHTIFTNTGITDDGDVWWEGMSKEKPAGLRTWLDEPYTGQGVVAHANSRFTAPIRNCPIASPSVDSPKGVPISGIIFGGRRPSLIPLVYETFDWAHGTLVGAMVSSETTAAMVGQVGRLRHDPFAMLPFCGYNMGDYFGHWLKVGAASTNKPKLPKIFHVNWFRQDEQKHFLWPGYGENSRVLKWMFERIDGRATADTTPIGYVPQLDLTGQAGGVDASGLGISEEQARLLQSVDVQGWLGEVEEAKQYFSQFEDHLPEGIVAQLESLKSRLTTQE